jgi:hypothetical protein
VNVTVRDSVLADNVLTLGDTARCPFMPSSAVAGNFGGGAGLYVLAQVFDSKGMASTSVDVFNTVLSGNTVRAVYATADGGNFIGGAIYALSAGGVQASNTILTLSQTTFVNNAVQVDQPFTTLSNFNGGMSVGLFLGLCG